MPFIPVKQGNLFYTFDQNPKADETIIFIHTNITDHSLFDSTFQYFKEEYTILRYDIRGLGKSSNANINDLVIDQFVEDLHHLITTLQLQTIHLIGIGTGAAIASEYTAAYPNNVLDLVLISMCCLPEPYIEKMRKHRLKLKKNNDRIPADYILNLISNQPSSHPEIVKINKVMKEVDLTTYSKIIDTTISHSPLESLQKITKPVLIISGEQDIIFPQYYLINKVLNLPNFRSITLPNCSHLTIIDQPQFTAQLIEHFYQSSIPSPPKDKLLLEIDQELREYVQQRVDEAAEEVNDLDVTFINEFKVLVQNNEISTGWNQRFAKSLLIYLLIHPSTTRETLCETLWPDIPIVQAKKNLTVYLSHLKKLLHHESLEEPLITAERLTILLRGNISCDLLTIAALLKEATIETDQELKLKITQQIIDQLQNSTLTLSYEDWFLEWREQLISLYKELLLWMSQTLADNENHQQAIYILTDCIHQTDHDEEMYDAIIKLYDQINDNKNKELWQEKKQNEWG